MTVLNAFKRVFYSYTESLNSHSLYLIACIRMCTPFLPGQGNTAQANRNVFVLVLHICTVNQHLLLLARNEEELRGKGVTGCPRFLFPSVSFKWLVKTAK